MKSPIPNGFPPARKARSQRGIGTRVKANRIDSLQEECQAQWVMRAGLLCRNLNLEPRRTRNIAKESAFAGCSLRATSCPSWLKTFRCLHRVGLFFRQIAD